MIGKGSVNAYNMSCKGSNEKAMEAEIISGVPGYSYFRISVDENPQEKFLNFDENPKKKKTFISR